MNINVKWIFMRSLTQGEIHYTKDAKICHKRKVLTKYSFKRYSHLPIFYLKTRIVLSFPPIVTLITRTKHFQRKLQTRSPWQTNELDSRVMRICESIRGSLGFPNNLVCIYSIGILFIGILLGFYFILFILLGNQNQNQNQNKNKNKILGNQSGLISKDPIHILFRDTRFRNGSTFIVNF